MPKIFRSMLADGGKPKIGSGSRMLGVRVAPTSPDDIPVNEDGTVHPKTGGMSVVPDWRKLPYFLVPKRLKAFRPDAVGTNNLVCWALGSGRFVEADQADDLVMRPDPKDPTAHGFVEPKREMSIDNFQDALASTQDQWVNGEI